jgi:predicted transcriptional regulator
MTYDALLNHLRTIKGSRGSLEQFAANSGVPYHTLLKIVSGETKDPGIRTVEKLLLAALQQSDLKEAA